MKQVQMLKPVKIWLKNCVFDEANPNEMSSEQDTSLGNSFNEFGYLGDLIVVNPPGKNGKQLVHHGEHRIKKLLETGNTWAWGFIKKMNLLQHKAYRQAMNKVRGSHDPEKDRAELEYFAKQNKIEFISQLIATPKEVILLALKTPLIVSTDASPIGHYEDTFLLGNLKQLHFIFDNKGFEEIMKKIAIMNEDFETDNHTAMFEKLVEFYFEHKK